MSLGGDQKLVEMLELAIKNIKEGIYDDLDKENIHFFITQYTTGRQSKPDPDILRYLFTGWFLHQLSDTKIDDHFGVEE